MSRKPIEQELRGLQTPRERMWAVVRTLRKGFTVADVRADCRPTVTLSSAKEYVHDLHLAGFVRRVRQGGMGQRREQGLITGDVFDLVKDQYEAPRLSDGKPVAQGLGVLAMWRAMKVLQKGFNHHDVAQAASQNGFEVKPAVAKSYVNALARAGYFAVVSPSKPGTAARYRLVKNTGPHAPAITRRKCVFDRNTGDFAELQSAQEVCDGIE